MLEFIKSQPKVVERMLAHVETSAMVDLMVRIIQLDEQPGGAGVLEVRQAHSYFYLTFY
jgi:serine/threonine-protein phosphatase 6 regulatory subunit 3